MTNNHDSVPDPSQWFEKFDPKYFFDAPRPVQRNNELWLVLAEQEVEFLEEVFWKVIVYLRGHGRSSSSMFDSKDRWTHEAHLVIPPLSGADIVSEVATHTSGPTYPNKTIVRRLIPKRKEKDSEMSERVEYFEHADGESAGLSSCCCRIRDGSISHFPVCVLSSKVNRVVYVPILGSASDPADPAASLPFYYPKVIQFYVKSFGYSYVDGGSKATIGQVDSQDESEDRFGKRIMKPQLFIYFLLPPHSPPQSHHSIIQLEILPFTSTNSFLPTDKMRYALTQLFHKLYKWCVAEVAGYRKRVHHDIVVPKEIYMSTYARMKDKYAEKWVGYVHEWLWWSVRDSSLVDLEVFSASDRTHLHLRT
ncbi:hypothetical protein BC938DRAFT_471945 [Jimgerdemannia flammicorona]|uniref:tRNA (uracil-O(2)-)-methyltransferase n=1 Tax=Jimgerdemannia flammicorona TaxID=994334 RepID=A0A433Q722_9FUNG|nr:hypothetical protein BC938DRAFT_471945 [Jimgerdemannia flammicorona]